MTCPRNNAQTREIPRFRSDSYAFDNGTCPAVLERGPALQPDRSFVFLAKIVKRSGTPQGPIPAGLHGFQGILFGKIAEKKADRGTFTLQVQKVGRAWERSWAEHAESAVGRPSSFTANPGWSTSIARRWKN